MTTKVIIGSGSGLGKKVEVDIIEHGGTSWHPFVKETKVLECNEYTELYIWNGRTIQIKEVDA